MRLMRVPVWLGAEEVGVLGSVGTLSALRIHVRKQGTVFDSDVLSETVQLIATLVSPAMPPCMVIVDPPSEIQKIGFSTRIENMRIGSHTFEYSSEVSRYP